MKILRFIPCAALLALAACSGSDMKDTLGLNREAPDEFVVVSRPPLAVPPDFDLMPPRPGALPPHVQTPEEQARAALLGKDSNGTKTPDTTPTGITLGDDNASATPSLDEFMNNAPDAASTVDTAVAPVVVGDAPTPASANFLRKLGAEDASDDIRQQLGEDLVTPHTDKDAGSLYEQIVGDTKQEPIVDPAKESERLRKDKDEDKPVTDGETPTQDLSPKSVLDQVF